jgi:hypothetical protein
MNAPKLTLGDRILGTELKTWEGAGEWVELVAGEHAGAALIVWRMEDDERSPECEALARLLAAASDLALAVEQAALGTRLDEQNHDDDSLLAIAERLPAGSWARERLVEHHERMNAAYVNASGGLS